MSLRPPRFITRRRLIAVAVAGPVLETVLLWVFGLESALGPAIDKLLGPAKGRAPRRASGEAPQHKFELDVKTPPGVHTFIGNAKILHLFEIEQPLAIRERVQRHDAQWLGHDLRLLLLSP